MPRLGLPWEPVAFLILLFVIPAQFVVPGFGAAGAPASLLGLSLFGILVVAAFHGESNRIRWSPVLFGMVLYTGVAVGGYVNAHTQALSPLATSTSDRALISLISLVGVSLFVASRVRNVAAIERILDVMIALSLIMCAVGLLQFFTGTNIASSFRLPGLVANSRPRIEIDQRSNFNRPFGTALHPIEFGVVTAALVPIAIVRAVSSRRLWLRASVAIIAFSALTALSRSAVLALVVMVVVLPIGMVMRMRVNFVVGGAVFVAAAGAAVPGLLESLLELFTESDDDPSVQARLARTPEVLRLISERPWFGRGFGVFTPSEYLLLDNEVQKLAIEIGVIGIGTLVLWLLATVWTTVRIGQDVRENRLLAYGLLASVLCVFMSSYTFDAFFYHILTGVLYVNLGLLSVLWSVSCNPDRRAVELLESGLPASMPSAVSTPRRSNRYEPSILRGLGLVAKRTGKFPRRSDDTPPYGLFVGDWAEIPRRDDPPLGPSDSGREDGSEEEST